MLQNRVGVQKLFNRFGRSSFLFFFSTFFTLVSASTFEDFKRTQVGAFSSFKEESDREFIEYLKSEWDIFVLQEPIPFYEEKKPRELFSAKNIVPKKQGPRINIQVMQKERASQEATENSAFAIENSSQIEKNEEKKDLNFDFFGTYISLNIPQGMEKAKFFPQSKEGIQAYYQVVAHSPYEYLITSIKSISQTLKLNDWGRYLLIKKLSENIFANQDESRLLTWFLFNKLGYSVRVGLVNKHIVVMHYSQKTIYDTPNYNIDAKKFYVLSNYAKGRVGKVFTYKENYPQANKALDLSMKWLPQLAEDRKEKTLTFRQYGEEYTIKYRYNINLINFMATYPQADYDTFFNTPLDASTYRDITLEVRKYLNGKKASVGLNFVLNFVQNAFKYETDSNQFGREKVMFAEEALFYDKSDCEDRSILFANLVKELFKIGVIGVKYKDHMATALYIPIQGDGVKVSSKKFIIADPSYMNASIGQSMPKYKRVRPESFIVVR